MNMVILCLMTLYAFVAHIAAFTLYIKWRDEYDLRKREEEWRKGVEGR